MWQLHIKLTARLGMEIHPLHVSEHDVKSSVFVARCIPEDELQRLQGWGVSKEAGVNTGVEFLAYEA